MQFTRKKPRGLRIPLLTFTIISSLTTCGSVTKYKVSPINGGKADQRLHFEVTNKWFHRKIKFDFIYIYSIKSPPSDFEERISQCSEKSDLEDYLDSFTRDIYLYDNKMLGKLERALEPLTGTSAVEEVNLFGHNPNFKDRIPHTAKTLSDGYYLWNSASRAIWSMGFDTQYILFKISQSQITILCSGGSAGM